LNLSFGPESPWGDVPCFKMMAVDETLTTRRPITHVASNACDFASINMLNLQLPASDRQIRLSIFDADRQEIDELAEDFPLESAALIHAGRTWASRTFPVEWWQSIVDKVAAKMPVVLMGKQGEIHGVLPVEAGKNVLDLRDRTTMGGMFELIRWCPVLLTNDSSPVHVAGAFDNSIVLIPSARHPDLVLPWRGLPHPAPYYKAVALFKKLTIDEVDRSPCNPVGSHADGPPKGDWSEYLPEVSDVVKAVLSGAKDTT
jgi:ADP-heptose:LPS heptosyltransferase